MKIYYLGGATSETKDCEYWGYNGYLKAQYRLIFLGREKPFFDCQSDIVMVIPASSVGISNKRELQKQGEILYRTIPALENIETTMLDIWGKGLSYEISRELDHYRARITDIRRKLARGEQVEAIPPIPQPPFSEREIEARLAIQRANNEN